MVRTRSKVPRVGKIQVPSNQEPRFLPSSLPNLRVRVADKLFFMSSIDLGPKSFSTAASR